MSVAKIASTVDTGAADYVANAAQMRALVDELEHRR